LHAHGISYKLLCRTYILSVWVLSSWVESLNLKYDLNIQSHSCVCVLILVLFPFLATSCTSWSNYIILTTDLVAFPIHSPKMIILFREKLSKDAKNILVVNSLHCLCTEMQPYIVLLMRSSALHDPCNFLFICLYRDGCPSSLWLPPSKKRKALSCTRSNFK
jgi:hypothetical protein